MKNLVIYFLFSIPYLHGTISSSLLQSKAAACGQKEQWQQAQTHMHQLMIDNPEQADIVYDSGVAAYRLAEFPKAAAYFENVTKLPAVQQDLKKQAHFNLGNTKVALGQLPDAITQYEQVLAIDPDNKPAQHNLEKVKEMLKQQQKQNQQQQQKKDQKNNEQNKDNQQNQDQNQNGDDQKQNNGSDNNKNDSSNESQQNNTQESSTGNQEKKQDANSQQNGQQKCESNDKSRQQDRNQQQQQLRDSHDGSSEQQKQQQKKQSSKSTAQPIKNGNKEQEMQQGKVEDSQNDAQQHAQEQQFGAHERWMARVLDQQEKADKAAQKALIKTNLNNQLAGRDGQNCW